MPKSKQEAERVARVARSMSERGDATPPMPRGEIEFLKAFHGLDAPYTVEEVEKMFLGPLCPSEALMLPEGAPAKTLATLLDMDAREVQLRAAEGIMVKSAPGQYLLAPSFGITCGACARSPPAGKEMS